MEAGKELWLFFVGQNYDVFRVEHSPIHLKLFTDRIQLFYGSLYQARHQFITQVLKPESL